MRHDVIGLVQGAVDAGIGQHDAGDTADREQEHEAHRPQHRHAERDRAAPHRRDPGEDLDAGRHRDHHRGEDEVALHVQRHAHRVHVVGPDEEADHADRHHGVGHAEIAEDRLLREGRDDVADDAEAGQYQDVHLGMAEEPEQVLEQQRVAAPRRIEEGGAEVAVRQKHSDRAGEDRQREHEQEGRDQHRPGERAASCAASCRVRAC